ncbi:hypothetical protein [Hymenobacter sp. B1770]|uniref:hypothetical protein n=1 Tax=Hymenobacter sp. B1770 TaxID=1718788 RepID=UPI003CF44FA6
MDASTLQKVLVRLPNLITLFFSLTLVTGFRLLNDHFHWNTSPTFDTSSWHDAIVLISFLVTLVFIITAWLGFSTLIERVPYAHSFNRFLFDAARISALFPIIMWSFLADNPTKYQVFVWGLAGWHLFMTSWYVWPLLLGKGSRTGHRSDLTSHALISAIYFGLGLAFYKLVAQPWPTNPQPNLQLGLVCLTLAVVAVWSVSRLLSLQRRLQREPLAAVPA